MNQAHHLTICISLKINEDDGTMLQLKFCIHFSPVNCHENWLSNNELTHLCCVSIRLSHLFCFIFNVYKHKKKKIYIKIFIKRKIIDFFIIS